MTPKSRSVYLVYINGVVARVYLNRRAARRHVELVRTTKPEALQQAGINPKQVYYLRFNAYQETQ